MNLFSRLKLEYAHLFRAKPTIGYFTSNNTFDYSDLSINTIAHTYAINSSKQKYPSHSIINNFTKVWTCLYVLPRAMYLNKMPFEYKDENEYKNTNPSKQKIGLYFPW